MSHQFYVRIAENVDRGIRTAPKSADGELSEAFIKYLKLVYSPEEAEVVQYLRMHYPKTVDEVIEESGLDPDRIRDIIQSMAAKGTIEEGTLKALTPNKRGCKAKPSNPLSRLVEELERENRKLQAQLKQAQAVIEVQKKLSEILELPPTDAPEDGSK